jgi:hypothetical protein
VLVVDAPVLARTRVIAGRHVHASLAVYGEPSKSPTHTSGLKSV